MASRGPTAPVRPTSAFAILAVVLVGVLAVAAYAMGVWTAANLGRGYTFDWYEYTPPTFLDGPQAALQVALAAAVASVVAAVVAVASVHVLWDALARRDRARAPARAAAWSRSNAAAVALFLALVPALVTWIALRGSTPVRAADLSATLVPAVVACAIVATLVSGAFTAWRVSTGRTLPPGKGVNVVGTLAVGASRFPRSTIAVALAVTLVLGYGMTAIDTDVDVADVLPRGDHNSTAAKNLTTKFKSAFTQQVTFQFRVAERDVYDRENAKLPDRQTTADPNSISDEVYIRALAEATTFVKEYPGSPLRGSVALPDFYKLMNWTFAGGTDAPPNAFGIPPPTPDGEIRYRMVDEGVWRAIPETAAAVIGVNGDQTAVVFNVDPQETLTSKEIGEWALILRDAYVEWAEKTPAASKVFTGDNAPLFTVDLPVANAHSSELAVKDLGRLIPPIAVFILVCLFVAFRHPGSIVVAFSALTFAVVWTFGAMGHMGIPLNTLNLTLVPLIMGVGIDYGIHMVNGFQEQRAGGRSSRDAIGHVGSHVGVALLLGTLTTVGGLVVMVVSPSLLIAQLGLLSIVAMASIYLITVTYIPAALALMKGGAARKYRPSPLMERLAAGVARNRVAVVVLVLLLSGVAYVAALGIHREEFGDPPRNWLDDDPLRREHEATLQGYYGTDEVKANVLVFEGDVLDPAAHRYMDAIEASLKDPERDRIFHERIRTLPFLMRTWLTVKDGLPSAGQVLLIEQLAQRDPTRPVAEGQDPYPQTREEMLQELDEIFDSPLYQFGNLFIDHPDDRNAVMLVTVRARTYEDAEEVWQQVWSAVEENEDLRPAGMRVAFVGNTATNYLFIAKELPWITYMSVAATLIVVSLVALTTRSLRATVTVGALSVVTGVWWLGILPALGIGLAITLTLPLVFIFAIGSDYGLHLSLGVHEDGDLGRTFRTTGKGVLFSFLTTFGAFLIYTQVSNLAVRRTMIATTVATVVIFAATLLLVPAIWGAKRYLPRDVRAEPPKVEAPPAKRTVVAVRDLDEP